MAKTQYYTATSIDGFIADEANSVSWLLEVESDGDQESEFAGFFAQVGAFAMGATTYEWVSAHQPPADWRRFYGDVPCWVFTHRDLPVIDDADIRFVQGDVAPVHRKMRAAAAGRNIWLVGGGELVGAFADQGLLDEVVLTVAPVTLGAGAAVLPRRMTSSRLSLQSADRSGQFVRLTYAVAAPSPRG